MRNAAFSLLAISVTALLTLWLIFDPFHRDWTIPAFHFSVTHTVLFQFKEDADPQAVRNACDGMMALRTACVNPSTLQPYIKSLTGGRDNSPEGLQVSLKSTGIVWGYAAHEAREMLTERRVTERCNSWFWYIPICLGFDLTCVGRPKVVEFASTQDRDYYVSQDPAHQELKKSISLLVESAVVVDWENGQF